MGNRNDDWASLADMTEDIDPQVVRLAEEFGNRLKEGEDVSIHDYIVRFPELGAQIKHVFPALVMMEKFAGALSENNSRRPSGLPYPPGNHVPPNYRKIGDYEIIRAIGHGGMGVVYLAEQTRLRRMVALKILPRELATNSSLVERFLREAQAAARMKHPGIVPVFDVDQGPALTRDGESSTLYYFTMQYIDGVSLDKVIQYTTRRIAAEQKVTSAGSPVEPEHHAECATSPYRIGHEIAPDLASEPAETSGAVGATTQVDGDGEMEPMFSESPCQLDLAFANFSRWREVARIGVETAEALAHAHRNEILHRDIKPSNLIVDAEQKVWVTDFGLAKIVDQEATATQGVVGTLRFMPPERFSGWSDPRSDVYSLGVTLYELATLKPAVEATDRTALIAKIVNGKIVAPGELAASIPKDLETIILKSIQTEPSERYQSAEALGEDLQRFQEGRPILARRATRWEHMRAWAKRNPLLATLAVAVGTLLLAISIGSTVAAMKFNDLADELEKQKDNATRSLLLAWESEAHAQTMSRRPGQKLEALKAIKNAVELLPQVPHDDEDIQRLRNEAIAAIALYDIELVKEFPVGKSSYYSHPSPSFEYYAWSDLEGTLFLCDANTGETKWSFHFNPIGKVAPVLPVFSPDSKYVFGYSDMVDQSRLFHCETGELVLELETPTIGALSPVAFHPGGNRLAVAGDPIRIYNLHDEIDQPQQVEVPNHMANLFWKDNSTLMAYAYYGQGNLLVYNDSTHETEIIETPHLNAKHWRPIHHGMVVGNWDGTAQVVGWPDTSQIRFSLEKRSSDITWLDTNEKCGLFFSQGWFLNYVLADLNTGNVIFDAWGRWPKFSTDGTQFTTNSNDTIRFYQIHSNRDMVRTGSSRGTLQWHSLRFNQRGNRLVAGTADEIQVWDSTTLRKLGSARVNGHCGCPSFLDDRRIIYESNGKASMIEIQSDDGDVVQLSEPTYLIDIPQGWQNLAAPTNNDVIAWRTQSGSLKIAPLDNLDECVEIKLRRTSFVPYFEFSPDGNLLAVADGTIRLFDTSTGELFHDFGGKSSGDARTYFQFSRDGSRMICTTYLEQMLFDLKNKRLIKRFKNECAMGGADVSPDGTTLALALDQETVVLRDAGTYEELARLRLPQPWGIKTVRYNPDGKKHYRQS